MERQVLKSKRQDLGDDGFNRGDGNSEEKEMSTDYVLLCGVMWAQHASMDACEELFRALHSDDPDVVLLASALLEQRVAIA